MSLTPTPGVKTSILLLDKALARKTDRIAFYKVENDGYDLGAQRRPIDRNDLPHVRAEIAVYMQRLREGEAGRDIQSGPVAMAAESRAEYVTGGSRATNGLIVEKVRVSADGECNLSGERYRESQRASSRFTLREFQEVCTLEYGASLPKAKRVPGPFPVVGSNGITGFHNSFLIEGPAIVVGRKGSAGEVTLVTQNCFPIDTTYYVKQTVPSESDLSYLYWVLKSLNLQDLKGGAGIPGLNRNDVYSNHMIPLPRLEVQKEIVAEIEVYQKVIDGARAVVENYRPHIHVDPDWQMVKLGDCCKVKGGKRLPRGVQYETAPTDHPYIRVADFRDRSVDVNRVKYISSSVQQAINRYTISSSDVYISIAGTIGLMGTVPEELDGANLTENAAKLMIDQQRADKRFLSIIGNGEAVQEQIRSLTHAVGVPKLALRRIETIRIPLPPLDVQREAAAEVEAEQALVNANRELIERFENKIENVIAGVWNE